MAIKISRVTETLSDGSQGFSILVHDEDMPSAKSVLLEMITERDADTFMLKLQELIYAHTNLEADIVLS